ncbi:tRNA pseudouridine(65) synthase TruC [Pseudoalteromonas sp. T1lg10]|uniref:tRNA pseudouridine(65) synthase TruC n=1 Tax=Pseudoalteromonas sp. T1lg10 TaxID=2077093 RepID=UPI000CF6CA73|nr:tRNA pseudouridine(65) synthase TruC [Pseudoalteromonas sp. T1lg10]
MSEQTQSHEIEVLPVEPLEILYRDEHFIAINKPSGLLVHRSPIDKRETQFAMQMLRDQIGQHVYPLHRLDRPTSGVLLFALSSEAARDAQTLFSDKLICKRYLALVRGFAPEDRFIDRPLKEKLDKIADKFADTNKGPQEAQTQVHCLHQASLPVSLGKFPSVRYSLVECWPKTGRKHQIRRHLNGINHPIINDVNHGDNTQNHFFIDHFDCTRLMLFATDLYFVHPYTQTRIHIRAPLGEQALAIFARLGWPQSEESYYTKAVSMIFSPLE